MPFFLCLVGAVNEKHCVHCVQASSLRSPTTAARADNAVGPAVMQAWSSPRARKSRGTPRHLSERQRQRRICHQNKLSPDISTDEAPAEVCLSVFLHGCPAGCDRYRKANSVFMSLFAIRAIVNVLRIASAMMISVNCHYSCQ